MDTGTNFSAEPQEDITSGQFGVAWGNRRRGKFQITFLAAYFATGICSLNIYRMAFAVHQLALLLHDSQVLSWNLTCSASLPTLVIWQTEFSIPSNKWVSWNCYAAWDSWITLAYEHKKQYWNFWWATSKYNLWLVVLHAKTKQKKRSITDKLLFLLSLQPLIGRFCKWNMKERFIFPSIWMWELLLCYFRR